MTTKRKQLILAWYDLIQPKDVDGIWGKQSKAATKKLQGALGIEQDCDFGPTTATESLTAIFEGRELEFDDVTDNNVAHKSDKDTNVPAKTGTFWDNSEFFDREEFRCQCKGKYCNGFPVEPEEELVRVCNEIRRRLGVPVSIVDSGGSGVRCPQHNASPQVGGVANSNHLYGKAADLHSSKSPAEMARVAEEVLDGTGELGIYSWGIHVGVNCKYSRFNG